MFKSRTRKILRDVWGRKGRTAMASIAIFIGVLGVVVLMSIGDLVTKQLREDKKEQEYRMLDVDLVLPGEPEIDNAASIERLEALPGVENVEGRVFGPLFWKRPGEAKFEDGWLLAAWEPFGEMAIEPLRLVEGAYPEAGKNEIAIERRMADKHGLEIGDQLVVGVLAGGAPQEETWTVVGTVFQPYGLLGGLPGAEEQSAFVTYADARHIIGVGFNGLSSLYARYIDFGTAEQLSDDFVTAVDQETPYVTQYSYLVDPASEMESTQQTVSMLFMLALMAMIVSGFLIVNIINTIIVEQKQQIGVMKSLGATRTDNLLMYLGIALFYGVIGTVPGVLLGAVIGGVGAAALGPFFTAFIEGFNISVVGIVMGIVMGLLIPLVAALFPVLLGTRVTILEAMTDLGIAVDYGRGPLARLIGALPLPINVRQALSNVTRKKGRLLLTWLTLTLAVGVFMGVLGSFVALDALIDGIFNTFGYQMQVYFSESQDFEQMQALITDNVAEVKAVYPAVSVPLQIEDYINPQTGQSSPDALGFDTQSDSIRLNLEAGTAWQEDPAREGVVLSSNLVKQLDKKVGDRFVFTAGGRTFEREVIGITSLAFDFVFFDWRDMAGIGEQVLGEPPPTVLLVQLENADASVDEVDDVIDQIKEILLAQGITAGFLNWRFFSDFIAQMMIAFSGIFIAAALVTAAVGAVGLLATLSMAVFERQKEIGVMRSIGASSVTIAGQFLVEGNLIGLLAWVVGVPLSFLVAAGLGAMFPFEVERGGIPPVALVIGLVGMIVIATISSLWPSISAARKTVSQIIRYQ
jgi:putative ABC transport system permease protein